MLVYELNILRSYYLKSKEVFDWSNVFDCKGNGDALIALILSRSSTYIKTAKKYDSVFFVKRQ